MVWLYELKDLIEEHDVEHHEQLRVKCKLILEKFIEEGISVRTIPETEIKAIRSDYRKIIKRQEQFSQQFAEHNAVIERKTGEIQGSFEKIPEMIVETKNEIKKRQEEIDRIKLEKNAATMASSIFDKISKDSDSVLMELSRELEQNFGEIISDSREVVINEFKTEAISITDAGGTKRPIEYLSTGTQDSFLFAARLALAKKTWNTTDDLFIILDEPFHHLDRKREEMALRMLRKFCSDTNCQVIIFSKDDTLVETTTRIFPDTMVHHLN